MEKLQEAYETCRSVRLLLTGLPEPRSGYTIERVASETEALSLYELPASTRLCKMQSAESDLSHSRTCMSAGFIDAYLPPSDVPVGVVWLRLRAVGHVPTGHNAV
jgi:hypothetical protein